MSRIIPQPFDTHQQLMEFLIQNEPSQYSVYKHEDVKKGTVWMYSSPTEVEEEA